jgi:DNA-binding transcriptional MerR regulator
LQVYERQGLIPPPPRSPSGYRVYGPEIVERVRFIRKAQALGLALDEVQEILRLAARGTSPCGTVQARLADKLREVDTRLPSCAAFVKIRYPQPRGTTSGHEAPTGHSDASTS